MFHVDQSGHLLDYLVCWETMAVKNFVFMENWVVSEVAGIEIVFFAIFDPTWTHTLAQNGPNMEFLNKQNFNFQSF